MAKDASRPGGWAATNIDGTPFDFGYWSNTTSQPKEWKHRKGSCGHFGDVSSLSGDRLDAGHWGDTDCAKKAFPLCKRRAGALWCWWLVVLSCVLCRRGEAGDGAAAELP